MPQINEKKFPISNHITLIQMQIWLQLLPVEIQNLKVSKSDSKRERERAPCKQANRIKKVLSEHDRFWFQTNSLKIICIYTHTYKQQKPQYCTVRIITSISQPDFFLLTAICYTTCSLSNLPMYLKMFYLFLFPESCSLINQCLKVINLKHKGQDITQ